MSAQLAYLHRRSLALDVAVVLGALGGAATCAAVLALFVGALRDAFLGLAKTCAKLGITFWDYLGARLNVADNPAVAYLPDLLTRLPAHA